MLSQFDVQFNSWILILRCFWRSASQFKIFLKIFVKVLKGKLRFLVYNPWHLCEMHLSLQRMH